MQDKRRARVKPRTRQQHHMLVDRDWGHLVDELEEHFQRISRHHESLRCDTYASAKARQGNETKQDKKDATTSEPLRDGGACSFKKYLRHTST